MSSYPVPPPAYPATSSSKPKPAYGSTSGPASDAEPLLGSGSGQNEWSSGLEEGDIPEDFKIGVTVAQSSADVRAAFVRKVYSILCIQLIATGLIGWGMSHDSARGWVLAHDTLAIFGPLIGAFLSMALVFWKRHSHPLNLIALSSFTLFEAATVGIVVSMYDQQIVVQAVAITAIVFVGLTLFTLQSRINFDGMGPFLFAGLLVFLVTSIATMFFPLSKTADTVMAGLGCLLFSLYIVYDTNQIMKRYHIDDWAVACVSLYLDIINLFLQILRLLNDIQDR